MFTETIKIIKIDTIILILAIMYQDYAKKQLPRFSLNKALIENFVFSNFNYCSLVWHFTSMTFTKKIFQKRVNRLLYND